MELRHREERDGYIYSPIIKQYDTGFWKSITGTPAISGNVLRFTSATAATYLLHQYADAEFILTVPTDPTAGDARKWGFILPDSNNQGGAYFEIAGKTFKCVTYDSYGNTVESTTVTWISATWTGSAISYRIIWDADQVIFFVNGTKVATHSTRVPDKVSLPIEISNGNADNLDLTYMAIKSAAAIV